jgi:asparagine synthase (glutamine-hydrolysing)
MFSKISFLINRQQTRKAIRRVRAQKLTYLSEKKMNALANAVWGTESKGIPGTIIEAGCALGGSGIVIATAKKISRPLIIYDVFGMIPPPSEHDGSDVHERYQTISRGESKGIAGDEYYGYLPDLYQRVVHNFESNDLGLHRNNISLVKGLVQDTLHPDSAISLAHIDVDWYEPVMTCLTRIEPHMPVGGVFILDDYQDWSGCHQATEDFFADKRERFEFDSTPGSLIVTKLK